MNLLGVVLAGGRSRRMGASKPQLMVEGRTLAERAAEALAPLCAEVVISVAPGAVPIAPGYVTLEDAPPSGRGPLAGIDAAFTHAPGGDLLVLACDYPRVTTALLERIVALYRSDPADLVFPCEAEGREHPLVGCWRRAAAPAVRRALAANALAVGDVVATLRVRHVLAADCPDLAFDLSLANVNTPQDLADLAP